MIRYKFSWLGKRGTILSPSTCGLNRLIMSTGACGMELTSTFSLGLLFSVFMSIYLYNLMATTCIFSYYVEVVVTIGLHGHEHAK
jgi:hypothetical protein